MQVMSNHGRIWRSKFFQNVETSKLNEFDIPDFDFLNLYTHECTKSRKLDFNHLHSSGGRGSSHGTVMGHLEDAGSGP